MNVRSAIYCRVSTDEQTTAGQQAELEEYVRRRGWPSPQIFVDIASGAKATRPGLEKIVQLCRNGKINTVVCIKLDRLGRSLIHLATTINEFQRLGVALICTTQGIDTSVDNPAARFQIQVLAAVAELERGLIVERVRAGLKTARARGQRLGREPLDERLRPLALVLQSEGRSIRYISRELKVSVGSAFKLCRTGADSKPL